MATSRIGTSRFGPALAELIVAYERLLDGLFPGDGSEAEPAGYEHFAMEGMSWGMAALHALDIRPRGFEKMMKGFWWLRYAAGSPGPDARYRRHRPLTHGALGVRVGGGIRRRSGAASVL